MVAKEIAAKRQQMPGLKALEQAQLDSDLFDIEIQRQ